MMYAITETSFRAISSESDLMDGESFADIVPAQTLRNIKGKMVRHEISSRISATNWALMPDADVSALEKNAVISYRAALRALVEHPNFPDIQWPQLPSAAGVGNETGEES